MTSGRTRASMAEREGFEPPLGCPKPDFESGAFDHSAISPTTQIITCGAPKSVVIPT
jgi:hypothetical protein